MYNHFKIIIPFYNVEKWIKATINSVKAQEYADYQCILIDDLSSDKSSEIAETCIGGDNRFKLIKNANKKFVLQNLIMGIDLSSPKSEDVIVILDGDDWFSNKKVLSRLNREYNKNNCWLTYGSYVEYPSGQKGKFAKQVPQHIIDNGLYRKSEWMTSHLRSWKYGLWKAIDHNKSFIEPNVINEANHFANCWDLAYMFPLLELAGNRISYIQDILYVYNRQNPLNVDKLNHGLQLTMENKIRNMQSYVQLDSLRED